MTEKENSIQMYSLRELALLVADGELISRDFQLDTVSEDKPVLNITELKDLTIEGYSKSEGVIELDTSYFVFALKDLNYIKSKNFDLLSNKRVASVKLRILNKEGIHREAGFKRRGIKTLKVTTLFKKRVFKLKKTEVFRVVSGVPKQFNIHKPFKVDIFKSFKVDIFKPFKVGIFKSFKVDIFKPFKIDIFKSFKVDIFKPFKIDIFKPFKIDIFKPFKVDIFKPFKVGIFKPFKVNIVKFVPNSDTITDVLSEEVKVEDVNYNKVGPVSLKKVVEENNLNEGYFEDLNNSYKGYNDSEDLKSENSLEKVENLEISSDIEDVSDATESNNNAEYGDFDANNSETYSKNGYDELISDGIKIERATGTKLIENFDDTEYAERKGALVFEMEDEDDELELLREAQILKQKEEKRKAEEVKQKEEAVEIIEKSKKANKGLLIVAIFLILLLLGSVGILIYWSREGRGTTTILNEVAQVVEPVEEEQEIVVGDTPIKLKFLKMDFSEVRERNTDVIAWLKSDALQLDYPIVQCLDNEFYLNHDLDKNQNSAGWLFVDCENNMESLDFNTIIYGHNRKDRVVFGNLKSLLEENTQNIEGVRDIQFTTRYYSMVFEICSVYIAEYDDTLCYTTDFNTVEQKQEFVNMLKQRNSVEAFKTDDLSIKDTFLTLSTCHGTSGTTKRLLVNCRLKGKISNR